MFFDRGQNQRQQMQRSYRNQLKQQINLNNFKIMQRPGRSIDNNRQTFSLLKDIEMQEQARRNKKQNYYAQLRNQIQQQKQLKRRKKQQQARKQRQQQEKIRKDNEMLRQRAEMQRMQESKKKRAPDTSNIPTTDRQMSKAKLQQSQTMQRSMNEQNYRKQIQVNNNNYSRMKTSQSQKDDSPYLIDPYHSMQQLQRRQGPYSMSHLPTYANRIENENFNFIPQRKYMDSYFQELLGQKRKFQLQANGISELNRFFYQQKYRMGKIQSRGLDDLKKLQNLLDQKSTNYMTSDSKIKAYDQYDQYDTLKRLTIPSFESSRMNQSRWRKLD